MSDRIMEWLDESQQLADQATEGPWAVDSPGEVSQHWSRPEPWASVVSCEVTCMSYCYGGGADGVIREEDAEFIAESRTRLPQAVAALRAVMELLDYLRPPDPHEPGEACLDCENDRRMRTAITDALGLEGDGDEHLG